MIIAITGYIGSGKTTTSEFLRRHGFRIINVDEMGHDLIHDSEIAEKLKAEFGVRIMGRDFKVDRQRLSSLVFNSPEKIITLNRIVHPRMKQMITSQIRDSSENVIIDVALFKELNLDDVVEKVVLVQTDVTKIYDRLAGRYTKTEIVNIMNNQHILQKADFIIENNGTMDELKRKVDILAERLAVRKG